MATATAEITPAPPRSTHPSRPSDLDPAHTPPTLQPAGAEACLSLAEWRNKLHSNVLMVLCALAFLALCVNEVRKAVAGA